MAKAGGRVVGAGGWREILVSKGIGKSGVQVIAVEMLVFIKGFTFWSRFVKHFNLIGNIYVFI